MECAVLTYTQIPTATPIYPQKAKFQPEDFPGVQQAMLSKVENEAKLNPAQLGLAWAELGYKSCPIIK